MPFFTEFALCGFCQKSQLEKNLKTCGRCLVAKYCGRDCQVQAFESHKKDCKEINFLKNLAEQCEENFKDFNLISVREPFLPPELVQMIDLMEAQAIRENPEKCCKVGKQNLFETMMGRFKEMNGRNFCVPGNNDPNDIWPRDYLVRRIRKCEKMWKIVNDQESQNGTEIILKDLLSIIRLDYEDFTMAIPFAGFMFLYLGRHNECYDFIKFWAINWDEEEGN